MARLWMAEPTRERPKMFDAFSQPPQGGWVWYGTAEFMDIRKRSAGNCGCCRFRRVPADSSRGDQRSDATRPPLHHVRSDWCECRVVALAGANPDDLFQRLHEDFSVAHFAGAC